MTEEAHELLQKALALPENERAELAGSLIASLDATVDQDVDAAWQQEVVRRLHEIQSGKVETVSWEDVQQRGRTLLHDSKPLRFHPQVFERVDPLSDCGNSLIPHWRGSIGE